MLKTDRFYGSISGESDKSNVQDSNIENPEEIKKYYSYAFEELTAAIVTDKPSILGLIEEKINERLTEQFQIGNSEFVLKIIKELAAKEGKLPIEIRNKIDRLILSTPKLSEDDLASLKAFLKEFAVKTVQEELETIVVSAPYLSELNDKGVYNEISKKRAQDLAEKYIEYKTDWESNLENLLIGEQKQTFHFAEKIGQLDYPHETLVEKAVDFLKKTNEKDHNTLLVNGLVLGKDNNKFTRSTIIKFLSHKNTIGIAIHLTRFLKPILLADLNKIKPFLIQKPDYLRLLEYMELLHLKNEELIELTKWLKDINLSFSLEILNRSLRNEPNRWKGLEEHINPLLYEKDILYVSSFINNTLHIEDLIKCSIENDRDSKKIKFILNEIIAAYQDFNFHNDTLLNSLVYFLLEDYWDESWPLLGEYILENQNIPHNLSYLLSSFSFDNSKLLMWVKEEPGNREEIAMRFMQTYKKDSIEKDKLEFQPEIIELINDYGSNQKMLDRLESLLMSYSINSNSAEKLYLKRKKLIETLKEHSIEEVRTFSSRMSTKFDLLIEREKNFETNYNLGF